MSILLEGIFVPQSVMQEIEEYEQKELLPFEKASLEEPFLTAIKLIAVVGKSTIASFREGNLKRFDASAGDLNCELQAVQLRGLYQSKKLRSELEDFNGKMHELERALARRKPGEPLVRFIQKNIGRSAVSEELAYLLRCRLLTIINSPAREQTGLHDGIPSALRRVIPSAKAVRDLTRESREAIRSHAATELSKASSGVLDTGGGSSFGRMKAVLVHLKEQEGLCVALKNGDRAEFIFLRKKGEDFVCSEEKPDGDQVIVIFQMKIFRPADLYKDLESVGFTEMMLMHEAMRSDEGADDSLTAEMSAYKVRREDYLMPFEYDHCYSVLAKKR